ncbi:MAG: 4-hydroxyphenylacetate 3-monooxygenase [Hydrogenibacillus schlegelii]|uniref:4-hydroxyphenylacetate 3-monooxygenase n=1 Tax=Hydrogenibacillus schlegelii TaxID=1484 RepID=A0A2T5G572_HYDSH|nr:4-hydroxyphenylacetate 3-hydroxylase N-terminal domain-containing protein [Hydrogenibacillus schlegelii]PTQ51342.1 MAG: 4-hydroxyphenylacetate 3-monooxygenase [Hydrogenibacillus schlegelii]
MSRPKTDRDVYQPRETIKNGSDYLESLRDGRTVIYHGETVDDVTRHPAFAPYARVIARIYDVIASEESLLYTTETGAQAFVSYLLPQNVEDLKRIREAMERIHALSAGMIVQGPEYKGPVISGLGAAGPYFVPYQDNVARFYTVVRDRRLYPGNAFTDPQIDRSKRPSELANPDLVLRVVQERDDGVIIRGAKMVSTAAPFNHEMLILRYGGAHRLTPEDADYAFIGAVPLNAPGLKVFSRQSFRPPVADPLDAPFSTLFDDNDSFLFFDDVFVPWERVFVYRDPEKADNWLSQTNMAVQLVYGDLIRWQTKFAFYTALAVKVAKANGTIGFRGQQERLGELVAWTQMMKALVYAAETKAVPYYQGVMPNPEIVLTFRALRPMIYKRVVELVQEIAGSGAATLLSSLKDLESVPEIVEFVRGAAVDGLERTKLYKVVWDVVHSDFASRSELTERLHTGNTGDVLIQLFFGAQGMGLDAHYDQVMEQVEKLIREV